MVSHWTYSVAFEPDIERGIQIRWTGNRAAVPQSTIVKKEKEFGYRANNFSLGNGSPIPGSTDLNATFNVGFKSNWVRPLSDVDDYADDYATQSEDSYADDYATQSEDSYASDGY